MSSPFTRFERHAWTRADRSGYSRHGRHLRGVLNPVREVGQKPLNCHQWTGEVRRGRQFVQALVQGEVQGWRATGSVSAAA